MTQGRFATMYTAPIKVTSTALVPSGRWSVGASILQTPGAIKSEFDRINADMKMFSAEITAEAARRGYTVHDPSTEQQPSVSDDDGDVSWTQRALEFVTGTTSTLDALRTKAKGSGDITSAQYKAVIDAMRAQGAKVPPAPAPPGRTNAQDPRIQATLNAMHEAAQVVPEDEVVRLFAGVWIPFMRQWNSFYNEYHDGSWWTNHAPEAEQFQRQLLAIRHMAKKLGMKIVSPDPELFTASILDPSQNAHSWFDGLKDLFGEIGHTGKIILYVGLGLGGLFVVSAVVKNMRSK